MTSAIGKKSEKETVRREEKPRAHVFVIDGKIMGVFAQIRSLDLRGWKAHRTEGIDCSCKFQMIYSSFQKERAFSAKEALSRTGSLSSPASTARSTDKTAKAILEKQRWKNHFAKRMSVATPVIRIIPKEKDFNIIVPKSEGFKESTVRLLRDEEVVSADFRTVLKKRGPFKDFSVCLESAKAPGCKPLPLPLYIRQNIVHFLHMHEYSHDWGCQNFVNGALGRRETTYWSKKSPPVDVEGLKSGDPVMLAKDREYRHGAIYLGHNLYLSKYGKGKTVLGVASLEEMHRFYQTNEIYRAEPIEDDRLLDDLDEACESMDD